MEPPISLAFQKVGVRRLIIASYLATILLAVPVWWSLTSIERLSLPTTRVNVQADHKLQFPIVINLDDKTSSLDMGVISQQLNEEINRVQEDNYVRIELAPQPNSAILSNTYNVIVGPGEEPPVPTLRERTLLLPGSTASRIVDVLASLLIPPTSGKHRTVKFAPRYRLAFTLLNEDAAAGKSPLGWDAQQSISHHIGPVLNRLSVLHNFTVESQVRFTAPLAFTPQQITTTEGSIHGLTGEDLTVFVNSAEWTLSSSVSNDPVLHFVLFVPSAERRPLRILDTKGYPTSSSSFVLPQWGGIVIFNPLSDTGPETYLSDKTLSPIFTIFRNQLLTLLGVPQVPSGITSSVEPHTAGISDWQLDALLRRRACENTKGTQETLQSIIQLVKQIENMPVGPDVRNDIEDSLSALEQVYTAAEKSATSAVHYSSEALALASRAFFSPGMLALLYFPAEHTYAVYAPLFAPISLPLLVALVREIKDWKRARRAGVGNDNRHPE